MEIYYFFEVVEKIIYTQEMIKRSFGTTIRILRLWKK